MYVNLDKKYTSVNIIIKRTKNFVEYKGKYSNVLQLCKFKDGRLFYKYLKRVCKMCYAMI